MAAPQLTGVRFHAREVPIFHHTATGAACFNLLCKGHMWHWSADAASWCGTGGCRASDIVPVETRGGGAEGEAVLQTRTDRNVVYRI